MLESPLHLSQSLPLPFLAEKILLSVSTVICLSHNKQLQELWIRMMFGDLVEHEPGVL